ncbi:hypothetical protein K7X08_007154 [Anisodus acutangulus]|uniref:Homeobox domain-containing protein n=1 Tax=Anisodus acutangulus TaxID=402998 RepID=A0A9Q1LFJ9_9SOLA|nr:hypothetical protein K7X08_007154 [Anisodus acutangulus]
MAEGFEAYHVPQQSRRDRLRGVSDCTALLPFYNNDPSLLTTIPSALHLMDPQQSSFQEINPNPFLYNNPHHQNLRFLDHSSFHNNMPYKQEPLSSSAHEANIITNNNNDDNNNNSCNNVTTGQGLSLSLSSHHHHHHQMSSNSSSVPLELNLQRYDSSIFTTDMSSKSSSTILGPFTGYASIFKGSRFLKPAEKLLEEICDVGRGIYAHEKLEAGDDDDCVALVMDPSTDAPPIGDDDGSSEHKRNKSKLISMLDEVYRRYKQYYQQLQGVVASFESVPGLGNAAPFANLSLKALSKHFRCLKNAITDQLHYTIKSHSQINCDDSTTTRTVGKGSISYNTCQRAAIHNAGFVEHQPVWRPQRGLPERAVTVLRAWLFDHFLHPYPTDSDKVMLAKQTGLSRNQVSNWFINARVRLWKPMVEEIHMLETRQAHKSASSQRQGQNNNNPTEHFPPSNNSLPSDQNPSTSAHQFQQVPSKRTRNNDPADHMNLSYDNFSPHSRVGLKQASVSSAGNGGVSLTLGLHQNNNGNGIGGLSEPFPRNAARRFGIDANNEGFMFGGGFEAQNRQLGRDHIIIGGQLLHDFVG